MNDPLQFDKAEFKTTGPATCALCASPIVDHYFAMNGHMVCEPCRQGVLAGHSAPVSADRVLTAAALGLIAAVVGGAAYYGLVALIHLNLSLFAVVLGFLVGGAVRYGGKRQGGASYQALALVLTYLAIAFMWALTVRPHIEELASILALPLRIGREQPLSVVIGAFALYEAWKINKRPLLKWSGPHPIARRNG